MSASETEPVTEPDTEDVEPDEDEDDDTEDEGEPAEGDEAEAEALVAPAQTDKEIEKRIGQLDAEAKRHAKRVNEILGEDALGLVLCEACPPNTPGFHYPAQMFPEGSPERALYAQLAGDSGAEHKHPDYFVTCSECNGFGMVRTGAQQSLATFEQPCPVCKTMGYLDKREQQAPVPGAAPQINGSTAEIPADVSEGPDWWGRPVSHPRHGKFPVFLTPTERAEDLAAGYQVA